MKTKAKWILAGGVFAVGLWANAPELRAQSGTGSFADKIADMERMRNEAKEMKGAADANRDRVEKQIKAMEEGDAAPVPDESGGATDAPPPPSSGGAVDAPAESGDAQGADGEVAADSPSGLSVAGEALPVDVGNEFDDKGVVSIFNDPKFLAMLGQNPKFVYEAVNVPDPMVFPPVRNETIKNELWMKADGLLREAGLDLKNLGKISIPPTAKPKIQEAIDVIQSVSKFTGNDPRYFEPIAKRTAELSKLIEAPVIVKDDQGKPKTELPCELPGEIKANVRGIVASSDKPVCLVGDFLLSVGESVPDFPNVKIGAITPGEIVFEVDCAGSSAKKIPVTVRPNEEVGFFGGSLTGGGKRRGR